MARKPGRRWTAIRFPTRGALVAALLCGAPALAAAAPGAESPRAVANRPGEALVRIAIDPETGGWTLAPLDEPNGLGKSAGLGAQLAVNQSSVGLVTEALPAGGYAIDLQGRFQSYSLARRDASGALQFGCDEDPLSLFHWLTDVPDPVDAYGRPTR